jgi:hypothetical protein
MQRPKEEQRYKQCNVQKKNRGTNNATSKRRTEGQTMQRPKEELLLDVALLVPLIFFWTLHCLSLCSSFGRCIVCPSVLLLDVALFVSYKGTNNATSKRRTKGQTMQRPKEE